jgi:hypothetical protein
VNATPAFPDRFRHPVGLIVLLQQRLRHLRQK